jgi:hypothetical protein
LIFDFNQQQIKEKNDRILIKPVGISLTEDRFGNSKSAIYLHGHPDSYLNLGTSNFLKPKVGTISIWVNLDRKIFSGTGSESNPIIETKNSENEDFNYAYGLFYDFSTNRFGFVSHKDSTLDLNLKSVDEIRFNKWYHLAVTFDDKYFNFYINGELQQSAPKRFNLVYLKNDSVIIGNAASEKNNRWSQGIFDDIQIYHRVLSADEILALYNSPNPNRFKNIIGEIFKYGIIVLVFIGIVVFILIRNKHNLKKQKEQFELINKISELELKVVKAQMNPHFISNCLDAIQELIYKNNIEMAGQYIAKFSYFLRQILNYSDKNYITLAEEIEIVRLNVELEQLRFKNNFDFQLNLSGNVDLDDILIPSLITQPFIENAIWHGLLPLNNLRKPMLKVGVYINNNVCSIEIEDNGVGRDLDKKNNYNSKGTKLVQDKIITINRLFKTTKYKLEIIDLFDDDNRSSGTRVIIQLENL